MSTERDFDRLARAWLELGPDEAPDRVVTAVLQAAETTPQIWRGFGWPIWRSIPMNRLPVVAGAAAILVVAIGGALMLNRGTQTGGVGGPPTASPTPSPTPAPSLTTLGSVDVRRVLPPSGEYRVGPPFGVPFAFTTESSWTANVLGPGEYIMVNTATEDPYVLVDIVDGIFADPCQDATPLASPVPRTIDGIIAGLDAMKDFSVDNAVDIQIDGHPGKEFDLTNTIPETATCANGNLLPIWTYPGGKTSTNPGLLEHIILLDVDGTPVAISWGAGPSPTDAFRQEIDRLIRRLDFE